MPAFPPNVRLTAALVVVLLASPCAAEWPQFRGPGGLGVSDAKSLPLTWDSEKNVAWKVELPGPGTSSPIVVGEKLFLTCFTGYNVPGQDTGSPEQLKRVVVCFDRSTGKLLWSRDFAAQLPESARIRENHGYASSTPAADEQRVYVFMGRSGVVALDHAGKTLWQADVGTQTHGWGSGASPVLHGDLLIVNASVESESLIAFDRRDGRQVWRTPGVREAWNTPFLAPLPGGKHELIVPVPRKVLAFDPATGQQLWSCDTGISWYMVPSVVSHDGIVYCTGGRSNDALAVRAGGRGDVTATHKLWSIKRGSNVTSPVYHDGHVYWMSENTGTAFCADAKSGELAYEQRIDRAGQVYAPALLAAGRIYYVSRDGRTFVVPAAPKFELLATNSLRDGSTFNAGPAVAVDALYVRSEKFLYCLRGAD